MKKLISLLLVCVMVIPFGIFSSIGVTAQTFTVPDEPTSTSDKILYVGYGGDGNGDTPETMAGTGGWSPDNTSGIHAKFEDGAICVMVGKCYVGIASSVIDANGTVVFTSKDPNASEKSYIILNEDGSYNTVGDGQKGMFMKDTGTMNNEVKATTTQKDAYTLQINSDVIFEDTAILNRCATAPIYSVGRGGKLVIAETVDIIYGVNAKCGPVLNVDLGGYAYLHNAGFSAYTGNGTIVIDKAIIEAGKLSAEMFADFKGTVVTEDGLVVSPALFVPAEPVVGPDSQPRYYIGHESVAKGEGTSATDMTASSGWASGNMYNKIKDGAVCVIEQKGYIGASVTLNFNKPVLFTALDPEDGISNIAYKEGTTEFNTSGEGSGQYGMFLVESTPVQKTTVTIKSDIIFDNTVLLNRKAASVVWKVADGGSIVIAEDAHVLSTSGNAPIPSLDVQAGGYAYLHNIGFSSYTGDGTIIVDESLVSKITADTFDGFEGKILFKTSTGYKTYCEVMQGHVYTHQLVGGVYKNVCTTCGDIAAYSTFEPVPSTAEEHYWDFNKTGDSGNGDTLDTAAKSFSQINAAVNNGGTVYLLSKGYTTASANFDFGGTTLVTAVVPEDKDYREIKSQYGALMWEKPDSPITLTVIHDMIFKDVNFYNRNSEANTLAVTNNSTVLFENVEYKTASNNESYIKSVLQIDEGSTVIVKYTDSNVNQVFFPNIQGDGTLIVAPELITNGKITAEQLKNFTGTIMTTEGEPVNSVFTGHNITLADSVNLNFYVKLSDAVLADANAKMTFSNGQEILVSAVKDDATKIDAQKGYIFTCTVAAKEMTDDITATLTAVDGTVLIENTCSVADYAEKLLATSNDAKTVSLVKAMLNYGATAQNKFSYNKTDLANNSLVEADISVETEDDLSSYAKNAGTKTDGVKYIGSTAVWDSKTHIRHYFKVTDAATTFKLNGEAVTLVEDIDRNVTYIEIADILPQEMNKVFTLEITNSAGTRTITYSVYSYFYDILNGADYSSEMKEAVKGAYAYSKAAIAFSSVGA